jgi:hypothetical protein
LSKATFTEKIVDFGQIIDVEWKYDGRDLCIAVSQDISQKLLGGYHSIYL